MVTLLGLGGVAVWIALGISRGGGASTTLAALAVLVTPAAGIPSAIFAAMALPPADHVSLKDEAVVHCRGDQKVVLITVALPDLTAEDPRVDLSIDVRPGRNEPDVARSDVDRGLLPSSVEHGTRWWLEFLSRHRSR